MNRPTYQQQQQQARKKKIIQSGAEKYVADRKLEQLRHNFIANNLVTQQQQQRPSTALPKFVPRIPQQPQKLHQHQPPQQQLQQQQPQQQHEQIRKCASPDGPKMVRPDDQYSLAYNEIRRSHGAKQIADKNRIIFKQMPDPTNASTAAATITSTVQQQQQQPITGADGDKMMTHYRECGYKPYTASGFGFDPTFHKNEMNFNKEDDTLTYLADADKGEPFPGTAPSSIGGKLVSVEDSSLTTTTTTLATCSTDRHYTDGLMQEAMQLEKSKNLIVNLIDGELNKLKLKGNGRCEEKSSSLSVQKRTSAGSSVSQLREMKNNCFSKIEDELKMLKTLDRFSQQQGD